MQRGGVKGRGTGQKWQPRGATQASPAAPEPAFDDAGVRDRATGRRDDNNTQSNTSPSQSTPPTATTRPQYYQPVEGVDCLSNMYHNNVDGDTVYELGAPLYLPPTGATSTEVTVNKLKALSAEFHSE